MRVISRCKQRRAATSTCLAIMAAILLISAQVETREFKSNNTNQRQREDQKEETSTSSNNPGSGQQVRRLLVKRATGINGRQPLINYDQVMARRSGFHHTAARSMPLSGVTSFNRQQRLIAPAGEAANSGQSRARGLSQRSKMPRSSRRRFRSGARASRARSFNFNSENKKRRLSSQNGRLQRVRRLAISSKVASDDDEQIRQSFEEPLGESTAAAISSTNNAVRANPLPKFLAVKEPENTCTCSNDAGNGKEQASSRDQNQSSDVQRSNEGGDGLKGTVMSTLNDVGNKARISLPQDPQDKIVSAETKDTGADIVELEKNPDSSKRDNNITVDNEGGLNSSRAGMANMGKQLTTVLENVDPTSDESKKTSTTSANNESLAKGIEGKPGDEESSSGVVVSSAGNSPTDVLSDQTARATDAISNLSGSLSKPKKLEEKDGPNNDEKEDGSLQLAKNDNKEPQKDGQSMKASANVRPHDSEAQSESENENEATSKEKSSSERNPSLLASIGDKLKHKIDNKKESKVVKKVEAIPEKLIDHHQVEWPKEEVQVELKENLDSPKANNSHQSYDSHHVIPASSSGASPSNTALDEKKAAQLLSHGKEIDLDEAVKNVEATIQQHQHQDPLVAVELQTEIPVPASLIKPPVVKHQQPIQALVPSVSDGRNQPVLMPIAQRVSATGYKQQPNQPSPALYDSSHVAQLPSKCSIKLRELTVVLNQILQLLEFIEQRLLTDNRIDYITRDSLLRKMAKVHKATIDSRVFASSGQIRNLNESARAAGVELMRMANGHAAHRLDKSLRPLALSMRRVYLAYRKACKGLGSN